VVVVVALVLPPVESVLDFAAAALSILESIMSQLRCRIGAAFDGVECSSDVGGMGECSVLLEVFVSSIAMLFVLGD
jgi:hypothetical protein